MTHGVVVISSDDGETDLSALVSIAELAERHNESSLAEFATFNSTRSIKLNCSAPLATSGD